MIPWYWLIVVAIIAGNFGYFVCGILTDDYPKDK